MADSKLANLTTVAAVDGDEYLYLLDDPAGTPLDRKVTAKVLSGWAVIAETVLAATATSVSFTSIPATFSALQVVAQGRTDRVLARDAILVRFNNDSGANYYDEQSLFLDTAVSGSGSAAATSGNAGRFCAASAPASVAGLIVVTVPAYTGTTFHKTWVAQSFDSQSNATGGQENVAIGGRWASTAAITRLDLLPSVGPNFLAGSTFTLYGLRGA